MFEASIISGEDQCLGGTVIREISKDWHGMRRLRLREIKRVNCEALMRADGQNVKRLLKKRGERHRPGPAEALSAFFLAAFEWIAYT
jgi:hypothetical protein